MELIQKSIRQAYNFEEKSLRVFGTFAEPWFCGRDVAKILGYEKPTNALNTHVEVDDKLSYENLVDRATPNQGSIKTSNQNDLRTTYINESGLYSLILRSKLESAKKFKKWITSEILPSIRKQGYYIQPNINTEELEKLKDELNLKTSELELKTSELERHKSCNIVLTNYVSNVKQRLRRQIIYIATTKLYAQQNNFKVGGCSSRKLLQRRLANYNTGRPQNDLYYFAYIEETTDYNQLEKRLKDVLGEFRDTLGKEMYVLHYNSLKAFIDLLRKNYDEEILELNKFIQTFTEELVNRPPVVPEPIKLNTVEVKFVRDGEEVESKIINLDDFDAATQREIIQNMFQDFKQTLDPEKKIVQRKEFENYLGMQEYKFKKMTVWNVVKEIGKHMQQQFTLKY